MWKYSHKNVANHTIEEKTKEGFHFYFFGGKKFCVWGIHISNWHELGFKRKYLTNNRKPSKRMTLYDAQSLEHLITLKKIQNSIFGLCGENGFCNKYCH